MKRFIATFAAALLVTISAASASADDLTDAKRADIEKLIEMTGALAVGEQMSNSFVTQMTQTIKTIRPDLSPELFDILGEEVNSAIKEDLPKFLATIIPVYHKFFSHQDIKEIVLFYQTPLGRKTIRVMPLLMQECMFLGQQWGQTLGPEIQKRVIERFKKEGVDLQASRFDKKMRIAGSFYQIHVAGQ